MPSEPAIAVRGSPAATSRAPRASRAARGSGRAPPPGRRRSDAARRSGGRPGRGREAPHRPRRRGAPGGARPPRSPCAGRRSLRRGRRRGSRGSGSKPQTIVCPSQISRSRRTSGTAPPGGTSRSTRTTSGSARRRAPPPLPSRFEDLEVALAASRFVTPDRKIGSGSAIRTRVTEGSPSPRVAMAGAEPRTGRSHIRTRTRTLVGLGVHVITKPSGLAGTFSRTRLSSRSRRRRRTSRATSRMPSTFEVSAIASPRPRSGGASTMMMSARSRSCWIVVPTACVATNSPASGGIGPEGSTSRMPVVRPGRSSPSFGPGAVPLRGRRGRRNERVRGRRGRARPGSARAGRRAGRSAR